MSEIVTLPNSVRVDLDTLAPAEQLRHKLTLGCRVVWPEAPELDGRYAIDEHALGAIAHALSATREPVGWADIAGLGRYFTFAQLVRLGAALAGYRQGVILTVAARTCLHDMPWPAQPVTIAR